MKKLMLSVVLISGIFLDLNAQIVYSKHNSCIYNKRFQNDEINQNLNLNNTSNKTDFGDFDELAVMLESERGALSSASLSLGIALGERDYDEYKNSNMHFTCGANFGETTNTLLVNKIGLKSSFLVYGWGIQLVNYTNFNQFDLYLKPEVSLTANGWLDIYGGFNIPLTYQNFNQVPIFAIGGRITIETDLK